MRHDTFDQASDLLTEIRKLTDKINRLCQKHRLENIYDSDPFSHANSIGRKQAVNMGKAIYHCEHAEYELACMLDTAEKR